MGEDRPCQPTKLVKLDVFVKLNTKPKKLFLTFSCEEFEITVLLFEYHRFKSSKILVPETVNLKPARLVM
jgi:hypothetical protein